VPWRKLLRHRQTWAFTAGKFITDPIWWFFLFYLPDFFSERFHLDLSHLGLPLIIVYSASTVGSIAGGWLPVPFLRMGLPTTRARLAAMLTCACLIVPVFLVNYLSSEWVAIGLLSLATAAHQGWSANLFTTSSDMFPRSAVGSVVGIGGMAGAASGALVMNCTGYIKQFTHSYASLFAIAASAYLTAFLIIVLLAPGLKKVELTA
jgi:ACS family hexuronate transporter-like MFS transporter